MTRASVTLNGVFSPRGYFNLLVRLGKLQDTKAVKLDLRKSRITIDFAPGIQIQAEQIRDVMKEAGYKPGPVTLKQISDNSAVENGPGWMDIKHPTDRNGFVRWLKENF